MTSMRGVRKLPETRTQVGPEVGGRVSADVAWG